MSVYGAIDCALQTFRLFQNETQYGLRLGVARLVATNALEALQGVL